MLHFVGVRSSVAFVTFYPVNSILSSAPTCHMTLECKLLYFFPEDNQRLNNLTFTTHLAKLNLLIIGYCCFLTFTFFRWNFIKMGLKMTTTICLMFVFMIQVAAAVHSTGIQVQIRGHTGFFDRNVIFKLLIFQPKN